MIDDASRSLIPTYIRDVVAFFFRERPARQDAVEGGRLETQLVETALISAYDKARL
jgi:hypothetical protein